MKTPKAVVAFMAEVEDTEPSVRDYVLRQLSFYSELEDKAGTSDEQWIGLKLGCSATQARSAIKWARTLKHKARMDA